MEKASEDERINNGCASELVFTLNLHPGDEAEEGIYGCREGYGAADVADVLHGSVGADYATDKRPAPDAEIEDAGIDAHRHSGIVRCENDNLVLECDVVDRDGKPPQHA